MKIIEVIMGKIKRVNLGHTDGEARIDLNLISHKHHEVVMQMVSGSHGVRYITTYTMGLEEAAELAFALDAAIKKAHKLHGRG